MLYKNIREEELKLKLAKDFFYLFDCTHIPNNIDFCVLSKDPSLFTFPLLWAEAKKGVKDILSMLTQLVLTIAKEDHLNQNTPPYLGV
ncbi:MAG: hypothetical protein CSA19_00450, partial [Deltaproteobacteria bacterium]